MYELMQSAIFASALIAIAVGIVGSLMLINRSHFIAASIAHGSYGGIGLSIYFGFSMLVGTTLFAISLAILLSWLTFSNKDRTDTLIGVIWAIGMSIGIIFTNLTHNYNVDLMSFLFGDIIMVSNSDLLFMLFVDFLLLLSIFLLYHHFIVISYDKDFAILQGLYVKSTYTYLMIMIALTVVMSIRSIGLILVIALFTIPPFIAEKFTKNFKSMIILSTIFSFLFSLAGLLISYQFDISATPAIILVSSLFFFASIIYKQNKK